MEVFLFSYCDPGFYPHTIYVPISVLSEVHKREIGILRDLNHPDHGTTFRKWCMIADDSPAFDDMYEDQPSDYYVYHPVLNGPTPDDVLDMASKLTILHGKKSRLLIRSS
jgi:hypothetical protein